VVGLLLGQRTSLIGMDFGACSVRAVQLQRAKGGWRIHHWVNIENEPVSAQHPLPDYESELQLAFGPGTFTGTRAALLLSPPDVEYKLLEVPPAVLTRTGEDLKAALAFELERVMPWPSDDLEIAAWPVDPHGGTGGNAMVVGARSSSVQSVLNVMGTQDLECAHAEIVPNAMLQVCRRQLNITEDNPRGPLWAVLDLGFRSCRLYMMHDDQLVFARVLRAGGRELTETLARELHVEFRIAEQYKRIYGIRQTDRGFRSLVGGLSRISEDALPSVLYAILRPTIDTLIGEIERSYRFALGRLPSVPTGPMFLIGGGARLQGLGEVLSTRLGLQVALPDPRGALVGKAAAPLVDHPACTAQNFPVLAPCIGLAMLEETA
jgi:type IV pilus assembly protein PilM